MKKMLVITFGPGDISLNLENPDELKYVERETSKE